MRSQNRKVKNVGPFGSVGRVGCLGLLVLGLVLVNPIGMSAQAFAEEDSVEAGIPATQASELVPSSVQIAFGEPVGTSSLTPIFEDGASALYSVRATVDVTNSGGYTVYLGSGKSELTGKNSGATINSVTSSTSYEGMPVNTWGYSYAEGEDAGMTFSAMPANVRGVVLGSNNSTDIKTDRKTFTLSFAAHVGNDKPADTYENEVTMSVVSSPREVTGLTELVNMQDMTSAICAASEVGDTAQLKDMRDGKYYWVGKLADNNCWMTQNLDLDLVEGVKLTADTSDVPEEGYTPNYTTATVASNATLNPSNTGQNSWSLGDYYIVYPNDATSCGAQIGDSGIALSACKANNTTGTPNMFAALSTPTSVDGNLNAHYLLGNHYQWNAATAGTGGTITSNQATNSICSKGWRLPTSNGGEFNSLVTVLEGTDSKADAVAKAPFYGVRGGSVDQNTSMFTSAGVNGFYWSSTPVSNGAQAYNLGFASTVNSSANRYRNVGYSVRCIAR